MERENLAFPADLSEDLKRLNVCLSLISRSVYLIHDHLLLSPSTSLGPSNTSTGAGGGVFFFLITTGGGGAGLGGGVAGLGQVRTSTEVLVALSLAGG